MKKILLITLALFSVHSYSLVESYSFDKLSRFKQKEICNSYAQSFGPVMDIVNNDDSLNANIRITDCRITDPGQFVSTYTITIESSGIDCETDNYVVKKLSKKIHNHVTQTISGVKSFKELVQGSRDYYEEYLAVKNCQ
ncbi:hypothetical protein [Halobacteriovorax sp. HLS]|uniref:hypothetical protein n=1 Tax=Halobacteriovorax sp. HLS TaxID=2234000 RepID=UPI000FD782E4|nr:hypothetical protein [Halobacteriovorax sp. HLS]